MLNLLVFAGWCVFTGFYVSWNFPDAPWYATVPVVAAIFFGARIVVNFVCQLGQAAFIRFLGFRVNYFEAACIVWYYDGERGRMKFGGGASSLLNGTVFPRIKGSLDSMEGYGKKSADYCKTFLGAPLTAALVFLAGLAFIVTRMIVRQPLEPISFAVILAAWFMIHGALTEDYRRRGGIVTYFRYRSDSETRLLGAVSQGLVETPGRFLLDEAQKLLKFRIESDIDFLCRQAFNIISHVSLADALGEYRMLPEIGEYIKTELLTYEGLINKNPAQRQMALGRMRPLVCAMLIRGDAEAAANAVELYSRIARESNVRDTGLFVYFADMKSILKDKDEETLGATDFLLRDSYGKLFKEYREFTERADEAAHQTLFKAFDEQMTGDK